ncbi:unnamed protein product [Fusarium graminearum]|nr:unnamed protein product [Fusarium graminearum]
MVGDGPALGTKQRKGKDSCQFSHCGSFFDQHEREQLIADDMDVRNGLAAAVVVDNTPPSNWSKYCANSSLIQDLTVRSHLRQVLRA